jgi:hypothetical protein
VLAEVRTRLEKRGWFAVTCVGDTRYAGDPEPAVVSELHDIWPDGRWASHQHSRAKSVRGIKDSGVTMPVACSTAIWMMGDFKPRGYTRAQSGMPILCIFTRMRHSDEAELWMMRSVSEEAIMRGQHGIHLGADLWPVIKSKRGDYFCLGGDHAISTRCGTKALLAAGPDGATPTERYESFREGVQVAEAILFVHNAITAKRISGDLLAKANALLDERSDHFIRCAAVFATGTASQSAKMNGEFLESFTPGHYQRDADLYALAGEVAKATEVP